jgi:DNA-binding XRE family transcriptional regulator
MSLQVVRKEWPPGPPMMYGFVPTTTRGHVWNYLMNVHKRRPEVSPLFVTSVSTADPYAGLTSLDDLIAQLTSTEAGRRAYEQADREWERKAQELIANRRLSRLRYRRIKAGLTQEVLAERAGIKQPNLQRLERPSYRGRLATYQRLAVVLGCDYRELLP